LLRSNTEKRKKEKTMTEEEKRAWGRAEWDQRKKDVAAIDVGTLAPEDAQKATRRRKRQSGMTPGEAFHYMMEASRERR
jgi:hypothetical protein